MSVSPIFCSIGHTGEQLHSFRVVVELRVEAQILLHEIIGCHVPLSILIHHTGILRENNTNIITAAADQKTKARCPLTLSRHSSLIHLLPWHSCLPPNIHLTRLRPINRATSHLCYQTPKRRKKQLLSADRGTRSQRRKWSQQLKSPVNEGHILVFPYSCYKIKHSHNKLLSHKHTQVSRLSRACQSL